MRVETKKEMREVMVRVFVAEDGTKFSNEADCREYEYNKLEAESRLKKLKPYMMEYDGIPLGTDEYYSNIYYTWFKADNKEDYEIICDLLDKRFGEPKSYPYYFCIETEAPFAGKFDEYYTSLDMVKERTCNFFEQFGIKIIFHDRNSYGGF